jgi:hypothetical protein
MYTINFIAYDVVGNLFADSINISVVDTILPTINSPLDLEFDEGETGHSIEWIPSDLRLAEYELYIDGVLDSTSSATGSVVVSLDGLDAGLYNYTIVQYDMGGNSVVDTVMVNVNEIVTSPTTTTDLPTTTSSTTTPTGEGEFPMVLIIVAAIGGLIVLVIVVSCIRKK